MPVGRIPVGAAAGRAVEERQADEDHLRGPRVGPAGIGGREFPEGLLLAVGQHVVGPATGLPGAGSAVGVARPAIAPATRGIVAVSMGMLLERLGKVANIVAAGHLPGRLPHRLHGGQQQGHQQGDDGDHHQQLDEREPPCRACPRHRPINRAAMPAPPDHAGHRSPSRWRRPPPLNQLRIRPRSRPAHPAATTRPRRRFARPRPRRAPRHRRTTRCTH